MEFEVQAAETNDTMQTDSNADIKLSNQQEQEVNNAEFTDTPPKDGVQTSNSDAPKKKQTADVNSANARMRREREKQQAIDAARIKGIIEALDGKNPYTNEPINDATDVEEFMLMRQIEKDGGDPLSDFARYSKNKQREREELERQKVEQEQWFATDRDNFAKKYPDVSIEQLTQDDTFVEYAQGKIGQMPLADIYAGYKHFVAKFTNNSKNMAAQMYANAQASPGSLSSSAASRDEFYTVEQVKKMSEDDINRNFDAIQKSMRKWKK